MQEITIERTQHPKQKPTDQTRLGFGNYYTDHMFLMNYDEGKGWHDPRIVPYGPIELDPAAMCLHYGQEVFEGLKAYRTEDGRILLFRPDRNMARLNSSNERLCIPAIDEAFAVEARERGSGLDSHSGGHLSLHPSVYFRYGGAGWRSSGAGAALCHHPFPGWRLLSGRA